MQKKIPREKIKQIADHRKWIHRNHKEEWSTNNMEYIGLLGEYIFGLQHNLQVDLQDYIDGDKGIDFNTNIGTIDVKTFRKAYNLIVEQGKVHADIYVLGQYIGDYPKDGVRFLGWEYKDKIISQPVKDFGYGKINHYIYYTKLKKINELNNILKDGMNFG